MAHFLTLLNILSVQWFLKNEKLNSKIKLSNHPSFVILIFAILIFRNIGRSTFRRSKFWPPPKIWIKIKIIWKTIKTLILDNNDVKKLLKNQKMFDKLIDEIFVFCIWMNFDRFSINKFDTFNKNFKYFSLNFYWNSHQLC